MPGPCAVIEVRPGLFYYIVAPENHAPDWREDAIAYGPFYALANLYHHLEARGGYASPVVQANAFRWDHVWERVIGCALLPHEG